jgi:two-component system, chemotaxis family, protein-glutamate methylesterase/glutaminase
VQSYVIAIGTSAGGLEALDTLVAQLPPDLNASIFIVQHMAPESTAEVLISRISRHALEVKLVDDGESFKPSTIYVARPDYHLLVKKTKLLVTKGARENRFRPGIDPLFRSVAVNHGAHVIGVVLTGMLNDGTVGLSAIQECGGIAVVQDPADAAYPEMPNSVLSNMSVDHCVPLTQMGGLLTGLVQSGRRPSKPIPEKIQTEAKIAERVLSDVAQVSTLGSQVPYNCPNCGGVLWEVSANPIRYRCHTGHSYTGSTLVVSQSEKIEETLWTSLRMFEERKNLLNTLAKRSGNPILKQGYVDRAKETETHIERIRAMLTEPGSSAEPLS